MCKAQGGLDLSREPQALFVRGRMWCFCATLGAAGYIRADGTQVLKQDHDASANMVGVSRRVCETR